MMSDRGEPGSGLSVLDSVALVMGASVASVHIRHVIREDLTMFGWLLVWCTFTWVTLTAAGPFLFLFRRFGRRLPAYPKVGDGLWAVLGFPWLATAVIRAATPRTWVGRDELLAAGLGVGLAIASLVALAVVWMTWVMVSPEQATRTASTPWTNRVGLILAVAWPIQCGVGLVVIA
jgi:hypothetical protein